MADTTSKTEVEPRALGTARGRESGSSDPRAVPSGGGAAYPVDLRQPPLLPGFEQAERLPSWRRQRGGRAAGPSGATRPRPVPARRAPRCPPRARRWWPGDAERGRPRHLPWNLLLSATDIVCAGLPPARGFAATERDEGEGRAPDRSSGGVWRPDREAEEGRGGRTLPSLPPARLRSRPPLPPPRRGHQRGYYAGREARAGPSAGGRGKCTAGPAVSPSFSARARASASPRAELTSTSGCEAQTRFLRRLTPYCRLCAVLPG